MIKATHLGDGEVDFEIEGNEVDITSELATLIQVFSENENLRKLFNDATEIFQNGGVKK